MTTTQSDSHPVRLLEGERALGAKGGASQTLPPVQEACASAPNASTPAGFGPLVLAWLQSENGKELSQQCAVLVGTLAKSRMHGAVRETSAMLGRYALMVIVIGAACYLQMNDKLEPALIGLLSLALGYLFGRQKTDA